MKKLITKEDVFNLLSALTASIALGAAIETGLLEMLTEKTVLSHAKQEPGIFRASVRLSCSTDNL